MKALKRNILNGITLLALAMLSSSAYAQVYSTNSAHAEVRGTASVAPDYAGVSDQLQGTINLDENTVSFQLRLESLTTGRDRRDRHMYEALEVSQYPYARLQGELRGFNEYIQGPQQVTVAGNFTIHGQSKYIEIPGTLEQKSNGLEFTASFPIYINNFGIERPSFLFSKVDDLHKIEVSGFATLEEGA